VKRATPLQRTRGAGEGKATVRRDPATRRTEILDAALDLFADQGFQGTSVREIARVVGVNEATLYHYFKSKAEILEAIIDVLLKDRGVVFAAVEDRRLSLEKVLLDMTHRSLALMHAPREQKLLRLLMIEGPRLAVTGKFPFLRLIHDSGVRINQVFETLIATGRMRARNPRLTAMQFLAPIFIYGFHQHGLGGSTEEPIPEAEFARAHVELFACALAP
jgi:AcrR family transcriptional regulator